MIDKNTLVIIPHAPWKTSFGDVKQFYITTTLQNLGKSLAITSEGCITFTEITALKKCCNTRTTLLHRDDHLIWLLWHYSIIFTYFHFWLTARNRTQCSSLNFVRTDNAGYLYQLRIRCSFILPQCFKALATSSFLG